MPGMSSDRSFLKRYAWLSIAAALLTVSLKMAATILTDSVGLFSDALESLVNLVGGVMALAMLSVAARPADEDHAFGHSKAEYFSSGLEGALILFAALAISVAAVWRLFEPRPLLHLGLGAAVSFGASLINLGVAVALLRAGKRYRSITIEANAQHLLTDVWTSAGVLLGLGAVHLSGLYWLDPLLALLVAANIVRVGFGILRRSVMGLMDAALPAAELQEIERVLSLFCRDGVHFHALRTRQSGAERFITLHVLVPGDWTVHRGHGLLEQIEGAIREGLPGTTVFTHLESREDPAAWDDLRHES